MGVRKATKKIGEVGIRSVESKGMELHLVLDPMLPPLPTEVGTHGWETLVAVRVGMDRDWIGMRSDDMKEAIWLACEAALGRGGEAMKVLWTDGNQTVVKGHDVEAVDLREWILVGHRNIGIGDTVGIIWAGPIDFPN
jgi:hypothetical protein